MKIKITVCLLIISVMLTSCAGNALRSDLLEYRSWSFTAGIKISGLLTGEEAVMTLYADEPKADGTRNFRICFSSPKSLNGLIAGCVDTIPYAELDGMKISGEPYAPLIGFTELLFLDGISPDNYTKVYSDGVNITVDIDKNGRSITTVLHSSDGIYIPLTIETDKYHITVEWYQK